MRGEDASNVGVIPTQDMVTQQILRRWKPLKDLKESFAVSHRTDQLCQRVHQHVVTTVEDSALRTEMENLESDDEDTTMRVLWYKPMSWLGQIRSHHRDESWSAGLCQAFFVSCVGATGLAVSELPLS